MQSIFAQNEYLTYDREEELKKFDETKAGVKGLVDAGTMKVPPLFLLPENEVISSNHGSKMSPTHLQIPVIDMKDVFEDTVRRKEIVTEILHAAETWGFFQVANHGVSKDIMEEMIEGVRRFHEQPTELKMEYYSRDSKNKVKFLSNQYLHKVKVVNWRDSLYFSRAPQDVGEFPEVCREITIKYSELVTKLGVSLIELLAEALGLKPNHLVDIDCGKEQSIVCHYYPPCPEPNRAIGNTPHKDPSFITIVMQDQIGGLQVLHQSQWVDVTPVPGSFVVNIGDLLQLISNDKLKSVEHRVLANDSGPRISVACFLTTDFYATNRIYGPIKELISDENPPLFKEVPVRDYIAIYKEKGPEGSTHALDHFRL